MKSRDDSPSDIVFKSALATTADFIRSTRNIVQGIMEYSRVYGGIAKVYEETRDNLLRYIKDKKWTSPRDKKKLDIRDQQLIELILESRKLEVLCSKFVEHILARMDGIERVPIMKGFIDQIEFPAEDDDDDVEQND